MWGKVIFQTIYYTPRSFPSEVMAGFEVCLPAQCLLMFPCRIQDHTNKPMCCLSQGSCSSGCVEAWWPGSVCHLAMVLPSPQASRQDHQVSCHHRVHLFGYLTTVSHNSTSLQLVYGKSSLMPILLRQVCGTMECKRQIKQIYTWVHVQPLYSPEKCMF